jgi:hypothetical protein
LSLLTLAFALSLLALPFDLPLLFFFLAATGT